MRKAAWLVTALAVIGLGYGAFQRYKIYLPGLIASIREPIGDYREVTWDKGPATAPKEQRPPNVSPTAHREAETAKAHRG